jgi:hypothetical protein
LLENLLTAVFTTARIALHRAWTRKRGHWRPGVLGGEVNGKPDRAVLLGEYAGFAFLFTLAHGLFVALFVFGIAGDHPDWTYLHFSAGQFRQGAWQILAVLSAAFLADAVQIRWRSFAWMKAYAQQRMARVAVMHVTIVAGVWAMAATGSQLALLYALIGLKTVWGAASAAAGAAVDSGPARPPGWLLRFANKYRRDEGGAKALIAKWQRDRERIEQEAVEDEQVEPA